MDIEAHVTADGAELAVDLEADPPDAETPGGLPFEWGVGVGALLALGPATNTPVFVAAGLGMSAHLAIAPSLWRVRLALDTSPGGWLPVQTLCPGGDYCPMRFAVLRLTVGAQVAKRWELGLVGGVGLAHQELGAQARYIGYGHPATGWAVGVVADAAVVGTWGGDKLVLVQVQLELSRWNRAARAKVGWWK